MLLSMTGFGVSSSQWGAYSATVEVKAVNNRYLKLSLRAPDAFNAFEPEFEKVVREFIERGTVNVTVKMTPAGQSSQYTIDKDALRRYWNDLSSLALELRVSGSDLCQQLLGLPGVVSDKLLEDVEPDAAWSFVSGVLRSALKNLSEFRQREGAAMAAELVSCCQQIAEQLQIVVGRAPEVVAGYREKMLQRVIDVLKEVGAAVTGDDLIREVAIFADRCDINEEIKRLQCHLQQFHATVSDSKSQGRKLDFLTQEMFREVNTIGSKANDVVIAHRVVEMKAVVERIREILQNVE